MDSTDLQEIVDVTPVEGESNVTQVKTKIQMGKTCGILPSEYAKLRQKEKSNCKRSKTSNFSALSAGADTLLANKPLMRTKLPEKRPQKTAEVAEEKKPKEKESKARESSDEEDYRSYKSQKKSLKMKKLSDPEHFCKVCDVLINSEQTFISHVQGKKHQKKLAALTGLPPMNVFQDEFEQTISQQARIEETLPPYREVQPDALSRVQNKLDKLENACVGLSHVSEIRRINTVADAIYFCNLCYSICQPTTIVSHVVGYKHRLNYMKIMAPRDYVEVKDLSVKKSELSSILENHAEKLEERYGRGTIVIEQELEEPPDDERALKETRPQDQSLKLEKLCTLPAVTRLDMLEELKSIRHSEIWNMNQFQDMYEAMLKLREQVMRYKGVDESEYDYRDVDYKQSFPQMMPMKRSLADDIPPFPYGEQAGMKMNYPPNDHMPFNQGAKMNQPMEGPMLGDRNPRMVGDLTTPNRYSSYYGPDNRNRTPQDTYMTYRPGDQTQMPQAPVSSLQGGYGSQMPNVSVNSGYGPGNQMSNAFAKGGYGPGNQMQNKSMGGGYGPGNQMQNMSMGGGYGPGNQMQNMSMGGGYGPGNQMQNMSMGGGYGPGNQMQNMSMGGGYGSGNQMQNASIGGGYRPGNMNQMANPSLSSSYEGGPGNRNQMTNTSVLSTYASGYGPGNRNQVLPAPASSSYAGGYASGTINQGPPASYMPMNQARPPIRNPVPSNGPPQSEVKYPQIQNYSHFRSMLF